MIEYVVLYLLLLGIGVFGAYSIVYPERAFRYENLFQVSEVELTPFGELMQMVGGLLAVGIGAVFSLALSGAHWLFPAVYVGVVVGSFVRFYGRRPEERSRTA